MRTFFIFYDNAHLLYNKTMHDITIPDDKDDFATASIHQGHDQGPKEPSEMVKVKFSSFVQLVATHDFEGVLKDHGESEVIVSTNLLTDLANAHEEKEEGGSKLPVIFLVGIIIGIVATYVIIQF